MLPPNIKWFYIFILRKPDKDPAPPSSYCPISHITAVFKMICMALARRIEKNNISHIAPDQTGFRKGWPSTHNTQRPIDIINYYNIQNTEAIIISLDAETDFAWVNWIFSLCYVTKIWVWEWFSVPDQNIMHLPRAWGKQLTWSFFSNLQL